MIETDTLYIEKTLTWIRDFVIALNLCPFAKREVDRGALHMQVSHAETEEQALKDLLEQIKTLDKTPTIATTILIFPQLFSDFFHYLDFVDYAENSLFKEGYEGIYQLATFHPEYCFADVDQEDITNYTNRSPWPMLHLLREESVEKAIEYYGDTNRIVENNKQNLKKYGKTIVSAFLQGGENKM